ncbi:hypothetical protein Vafri_15427 [Volvox africanus]|uniref:Uncharacterized protein n=2 Tax=Volvox africanus TaxID=51714 RepID=A0A8J4F7Z0_9CHLO|nr:hypothetical protein Vafri_15427 [Volvox africanus]
MVSCSRGVAEAAGLVPEPECWKAVFEELPRLLFGGKRHSGCTRFLLLLHTLMEAGQAAEALEASVAALHGSLPRFPPASADVSEEGEEGLCFGTAWYRKNANPDPDPAEAAPRRRDTTRQRRCIGGADTGAGAGDDVSTGSSYDDDGGGDGGDSAALSYSGSETGGGEEEETETVSGSLRSGGGGVSHPNQGGRRRRVRKGAEQEGPGGDGAGVETAGARASAVAESVGRRPQKQLQLNQEEEAGGEEVLQRREGLVSEVSVPSRSAPGQEDGGERAAPSGPASAAPSRWHDDLSHVGCGRGGRGLGSLAQMSAPSAVFGQEVLDIGPEMHW